MKQRPFHITALSFRPAILIAALAMCLAGRGYGVTLDNVLDRTLEKNPLILQAKAKLEQASGERLVLHSITWPSVTVGGPVGIQGGRRATGENSTAFAFASGSFTQPFFNAAILPSRRLGNIGLLVAEQELNVVVVEQLHQARLAFYSAIYNRELQSVRETQKKRLDQNVASQKERYEAGLSDRATFTSANIQAAEMSPQIETARRAYADAKVKLSAAMGEDLGPDVTAVEPDRGLQFGTIDLVDNTPDGQTLEAATKAALERRADVRLARLLVRAANEEQRIIEAGYYPTVGGNVFATYIPTTAVHQQGSTSRNQDVLNSEIRPGVGYTWRVVDNGKVGGAVLKHKKAREINEIECRKLEMNVARELVQIRNGLAAAAAARKSLESALTVAEESVSTVQQNKSGGLISELDYRLAENASLDVKSGLLDASYQENIAFAEWDRATGRYFRFTDDTAPKSR